MSPRTQTSPYGEVTISCYGNPLEREVDLIVEDVRNEFITRETAREIYGFVFKGDTCEVDKDATAKARKS